MISQNLEVKKYERKVTGAERFFSHSPFSMVTMVARIKGNVTEEMLKNAVVKVQQRHALLRVRIVEDDEHDPWFTSEAVKDIPIEIALENRRTTGSNSMRKYPRSPMNSKIDPPSGLRWSNPRRYPN